MLFSFGSLYNSEGTLMRVKRPKIGLGAALPRVLPGNGARLSEALHLLRRLRPACLALAAVGATTWLSFHFGQGFPFTGFLYLVLVVLTALYGGFWQATAISIVAAGCLDYYFVPPLFSFVSSPEDWVALGAFEFTALVISRLSIKAQMIAAEAVAGRRDMERLYETSRRILLLNRAGEPGEPITTLIRETFDLKTVTLFDAVPAATFQSGEPSPDAERRTRDAYCLAASSFDQKTNSWYCVVRVGTRAVGGLGLSGTAMTSLAATALASLTGIALERARAAQNESRAEAARQTEELRTAVLDALAHEFKTPLTVVRTASSGLLAVGGLSELQADLLTVIDRQAATLDHLTQRLLRSARLDTVHFVPRLEAALFSDLIHDTVGGREYQGHRHRFQLAMPELEAAVLADREQIRTALSQLLDNALRYSEPGSTVHLFVVPKENRMVLTVRSKGPVMSPQECERIFERFYRAPQTQDVSAGSGLGLSIVKKIMKAHRGSAWAEPEAGYGTSFSISLPFAGAR
jgi:two-component system sensor histidine kinase KdpD